MFKKSIFFLLTIMLIMPTTSLAAPTTEVIGNLGMVSINFDDGLEGVYSLAAPIMAEYSMTGTAYIYPEAQNLKEPGYYDEFMSWPQLQSLQNDFGWEIGSHAYTHDNLTEMPLWQAKWEIYRSRQDLVRHGLQVESFASPFGAFNDGIVNFVSKLFSSHRTAWNLPNTWPINNYYLKAKPVLPNTPVSEVKTWIDQAKANNEWLILYFHNLTTGAAQPELDDYNTEDFREILEYLAANNLLVMNNTPALEAWGTGPNLVANNSFEQGIGYDADAWVRSNTKNVKILSNRRGVYPEHKRSLLIKGSSQQNSLSSYGIGVQADKNYRLKAFCRVSKYVSGDASVWISEFDENYNYVGGQWLGGFWGNWIGTRYFDYTPNVGTSKIEIYFLTHSGAKMKLEVDGVELKEK